jgi:hypothetical protein
MIRYPIHPRELAARVERQRPGWTARAAERTEGFRRVGRYDERSSIWSDIKRTFMELQGFKCGFCERRLEKSPYGNIEHDVEHFRPKAKVTSWPSDAARKERQVDFPFALGRAADPGYYLLAYHLENYLIACKTCNSALKANCFPVANGRDTGGRRTRDLTTEKAYLIYPISASDEDPERLITFRGILPVPVATKGHARKRALVTIRFFELDSREILLEERAAILVQLHLAMTAVGHPDPFTSRAADIVVSRLVDRLSPHANCARAYHDLWLTDHVLARDFAEAAVDYLVAPSRSGPDRGP